MARPLGLNEEPIGYDARLLRHLRRQQEHRAHMRILLDLAEETGGNIAEEREKARRRWAPPDPVDLRGIPAVGRGVGGAIRGTRPDRSNLFR